MLRIGSGHEFTSCPSRCHFLDKATHSNSLFGSHSHQTSISKPAQPQTATSATIFAMKQRIALLLAVTAGVAALAARITPAQEKEAKDAKSTYTVRTLALPDHGKGTTNMDYIAYDA